MSSNNYFFKKKIYIEKKERNKKHVKTRAISCWIAEQVNTLMIKYDCMTWEILGVWAKRALLH